MTATPAISVRGLSKRYELRHEAPADTLRDAVGQKVRGLWRRLRHRAATRESFWALKDVSFDVEPGEVVGVIGRNGAGKSTLLKLLSRITEPTEGRIELRGRVASLLEVGTGFHPELSGRENVFLNGAILGMTQREVRARFDEIVAFAEVERFIDTPVKHYSSGMYVRLAFAVAAHLDPEILIVDEVLAVGDAEFQQKCLGRMGEVSRSGRTVLFVSHNLASVGQLCSRALTLTSGRLAGAGPVDLEVARYMGCGDLPGSGRRSLERATRSLDPIGGVRLASVALDSPGGRPAWTLGFAEPMRLVFTAEVRSPLRQIEVGMGIRTLQGIEVVSTLSSWSTQIGPVSPGPHQGELCLPPTHLLPGTYRCGLGIRSERGLEDYLPDAFDLRVAAPEPGTMPNLTTVRGAVALPGRISFRPGDP